MLNRRRHLLRLAAGLAWLAIAGGWAATARADIAYAFAEQTISGLSITPTVTATSPVSTFTQDSSTLNGSGLSNSNPTDALQAYQGGLPAAPQNFFLRYAPGSPPVSPVGNFTRGDVAIPVLSGPTNSSSVVAESYLNGAGPQSETGSAGLGASFSFTPSATGALTISYNFSNDLFVFTTGLGSAAGNYHFDITIKDAAGAVVFNANTANTNLSLTAPPNGAEVIRSGAEAVVTPVLTAGTGYTLIFSSTAQSSVTIAAVPEPGAATLVAASGALALVVGAVRRRSLRGPRT